jgi:hypothetical protein
MDCHNLTSLSGWMDWVESRFTHPPGLTNRGGDRLGLTHFMPSKFNFSPPEFPLKTPEKYPLKNLGAYSKGY